MSLNSQATLLSTLPHPLAKWPIIQADLTVVSEVAPEQEHFPNIGVEYLCLAGLSMVTCDMRLGPSRSFDHIRFNQVAYASCLLNTYRWIDIQDAGLIHLTRPLRAADSENLMFQGWRLDSYEDAITTHHTIFKPCVVELPCLLFLASPPTAPRYLAVVRSLSKFIHAIL